VGGWLLVLERSPSYHVFVNVLNAAVRVLGPRFPEATVVRLDTEPVAFVVYVLGHALAGAALGLLLGIAANRRLPPAAMPLLVTAAIVALDLAGLGRLWQHRGLPFGTGAGMLSVGGVIAAAVAAVGGRVIFGLPRRAQVGLAAALPLAVAAAAGAVVARAAREPHAVTGPVEAEAVREPTGVHVVLLALDGLDGILVDEAFAVGRLPNLARLAGRGVRGDLRSIRPPKSPVVWTSAVTGMLPGVHGILDFVTYRDGERIPVTSNLRRAPALWNLAETLGYSCAFFNWYVTWPAEPTLGVIVSDRVDLPGLDERVYPPELTAVADSVRGEVDSRADRDIAHFTRGVGDFREWRAEQWGQVRRSLRILDDVVRHDLVTLETARAITAPRPFDLTALYFRGNDNTQHLFWKYRMADQGERLAGALFDELSPADVATLAPIVDRYYDFVDELVGEAVAMLPDDAAILVLSDHGFLTNNERNRWFHANRLLEAGGWARLVPGEGGAADSAASRVYDPNPPSVDARRLLRAGGQAADARGALHDAQRFLDALRTDRNEPLFVSTALGEDERGPRLAVVFARDPDGDTVTVGDAEVPFSEFNIPEGHSGDHSMNGFLLAAGGPFRTGGTIDGARVVDVAPTVLHLLGAPAALDMEGTVLTGLLKPDWLAAHTVRWVETYGRRDAASDEVISTEADERIREELRALGYLQ